MRDINSKRLGNNVGKFLFWAMFSVYVFFSGCQPETRVAQWDENSTPPVEALYHTVLTSTAGELSEERVTVEDLRDCIVAYCGAVHSVARYGETLDSGYVDFRRSACEGDLYSQIANSLDHLTIAENGAPLIPEEKRDSFEFTWSFQCFPGTSMSVTYSPLTGYEQRREIKALAFRSYFNAVSSIGDTASEDLLNQRILLYEEIHDSFSPSITGPELVSQMFASLPSIVQKMQDLKITDAEDSLLEGAARNNEWDSTEFGRKRAYQDLWEAYSCDNDDFISGGDGLCWSRGYYLFTPQNNEPTDLESAKNFCSDTFPDIQVSIPSKEMVMRILGNCREVEVTQSDTYPAGFFLACDPCTSADCQTVFGDLPPYISLLYMIDPAGTVYSEYSGGKFWPVTSVMIDGEQQLKGVLVPGHFGSLYTTRTLCIASAGSNIPDFFPDVMQGDAITEAHPVPMTTELRRAIGILTRNHIDYTLAGALVNSSTTDHQSILDTVKDTLLVRENDLREATDLSTFNSLDELARSNGTTEEQLIAALQYMYVHSKLFPRRLDADVVGTDYDEAALRGWGNEFLSRGTGWLLKDWRFTPVTSFSDIVSDYVTSIGLVPGMMAVREMIPTNPTLISDPEYADAEATMAEALTSAISVTEQVLSTERVKVVVGDGTIEYTYYTAHPGGIVEFALYPEQDWYQYDGVDLADQVQKDANIAHNTLCFHKLKDEAACAEFNAVWPLLLTEDDFASPPEGTFTVPVGYPVKDWVLSMRRKDNEATQASWKPVGVINTSPRSDGGTDMLFILEGPVADMTRKIASVDDRDLSRSSCAPIAGLKEACIDPYWVPAIDNEVLDSSGNQYEESYRHYLANATTAAQKAEDLREDLINDLITTAHEENVSAAQFDKALDDYLSGVAEICGDNINASFEQQARQFYSADVDALEEVLGASLETEYGCRFNAAPVLDQYVEKTGPVQCAELRDCSNKTKLRDLGLRMPKVSSEITSMTAANWNIFERELADNDDDAALVMSGTISDSTKHSQLELTEASGGVDCSRYQYEYAQYFNSFVEAEWGDEPAESIDDLKEKFIRLKCWISSYRDYVSGLIEGQPLAYLPQVLADASLNEASGSTGRDVTTRLQGKFGSGLYYQKLLEIAAEIENLKSQAAAYAGEMDHAMALINTTESKVQAGLSTAQISTISSLMGATQQSLLHEAMLKSQARTCVGDVDQEYSSGTKTHAQWVQIIQHINEKFWGYRSSSWDKMSTRDNFIDVCEDIARETAAPTVFQNQHAVICEELANIAFEHFGELRWTSDGSSERGAYNFIADVDSLDDKVLRVKQVILRCDDDTAGCEASGKFHYKYNDSGAKNWCGKLEYKQFCKDNQVAYYIVPGDEDTDNYALIATDLSAAMKRYDYAMCGNAREGCIVDEETGAEENCQGVATAIQQSVVDAWSEGGVMSEMSKNAAFLNVASETGNLTDQLVLVNRNLQQTRFSMSQSLKAVAIKISELSRLEEDQVTLFNNFINNVNISRASSYSNLAEWKERFDFKREQYQKQLRRARIAAWVARRAIEFRFGVDLSEETTATIYGDRPSQWADDIYGTYVSECGYTADEVQPEGGGTTISACLAPEERIEEYVEKLADYVDSYGNNPNDNWWFHEDDDMAVISLRDHLSVGDMACNGVTENLLFFSEELDLDTDGVAEVYQEVLPHLTQPVSAWSATGVAVDPDRSELGVPLEVLRAHYSNEHGAFEDQLDVFTADILTSPPGTAASMTQSIRKSEAVTQIGEFDDVAFSAWVRTTPQLLDGGTCLENEVFFSAIGRCGVPCETDGDCQEGQVCMVAGTEEVNPWAAPEDEDTEMSEDTDDNLVRMCNWCQDDGACIGQDGQAMKMVIFDRTRGVYAARNIHVHPFWTRASVNTAAHLESTFGGWNTWDIDVAFENLVTNNLIGFSEDFNYRADHPESWQASSGTMVSGTVVVAPDMSTSATPVTFSSDADALTAFVEMPSICGGVTGSIWLRNQLPSDSNVEVELGLQTIDGLMSNTEVRRVSVTNQWTRFAVEMERPCSMGTPDYGDAVVFSIHPQQSMALELWGAQVEDGLGATPYLPKIGSGTSPEQEYRNLIVDSGNLVVTTDWNYHSTLYDDAWYINNSHVSKLQSVADANPFGGGGVGRLVDDLTGASVSMYRAVDISADPVGTKYTFSMYVKGTAANQVVFLVMGGTSGQGAWPEGDWFSYHDYKLIGTEWSRITFTHQKTQQVDQPAPTKLILIVFPVAGQDGYLTGTLDFWGPQIEIGEVATDYQNTSEPLDPPLPVNEPVDWGLDIGVVGAQLSPVSAAWCDRWDSVTTEDAIDAVPCVKSQPSYVRNTYLREHVEDMCVAVPGSGLPLFDELNTYVSDESRIEIFKNEFVWVNGEDGQPGYYAYRFNVDMDAVESGAMGQFGILAPDNFNYRIKTVALNIVGTDVVDCSMATSPSTCAANQWLSYDLKQMGEVYIRNHHDEANVKPFDIPTGHVKGGKAWVAEQVIGFPVSGTHQSALSQMSKISLMGRPMQGTFELRLYEVPELIWPNVEDIQLVLGYHYWTKSE